MLSDIEVKTYLREITIARARTMLDRLARVEPDDTTVFAYGSTHSANLGNLFSLIGGGGTILYSGADANGLLRLLPLPKPRAFNLQIGDVSGIRAIFDALDDYLYIRFLFVSSHANDHLALAMKQKITSIDQFEAKIPGPFAVYAVDTDSDEYESGLAEEIKIVGAVPMSIYAALDLRN